MLRRRSLRPVSERQLLRQSLQQRAEREGAGAFRAAIRGERCVVCDRTSAEALKATGFGHQAHHAIRQQVLRRLGLELLLWAPGNAVATCEEPCHRRHTNRQRRIPRSALPARVFEFVGAHGLEVELEREYPS